jgi:hypothetical protein
MRADCPKHHSWNTTNTLDLPAAALVAKRPYAKMLAIVRQNPVVGFAQARERSRHHFATIEALQVASNPDDVASSETLERNLFHRSAPEPVCKTSVVHDAPVADIDAVVRVEPTRCDEVRCERRFGARSEMYITVLEVAYIVSPPAHEG